jgi:cystine transport system substrate-binding protein
MSSHAGTQQAGPERWKKTMKLVPTLLVAAAFVQLVSFSSAYAGENLEAIKSAGALKIGTEGTYAPFTYHDESGKLVGFDVEIGEAVAKKLGVKAEFLEGKWDGLIAGLDANRYDAVINQVGITEERKKKYDFSEPYIASKAVLIVKSDNADIKDFPDLKGKNAAQSLSSNFGKIAQAAGAELVGTDGFDQSIQLVLTGRADATVNDSLSFLDFKKKKPDAPVKIAAEQANADFSGIIVRKGEPELLEAINKALVDIRADGTYDAISQKYFGADVSK